VLLARLGGAHLTCPRFRSPSSASPPLPGSTDPDPGGDPRPPRRDMGRNRPRGPAEPADDRDMTTSRRRGPRPWSTASGSAPALLADLSSNLSRGEQQ